MSLALARALEGVHIPIITSSRLSPGIDEGIAPYCRSWHRVFLKTRSYIADHYSGSGEACATFCSYEVFHPLQDPKYCDGVGESPHSKGESFLQEDTPYTLQDMLAMSF